MHRVRFWSKSLLTLIAVVVLIVAGLGVFRAGWWWEYRMDAFSRLTQSFSRMVEELERADQQRRNLTADIAHELRTPLHIIQDNLEDILDDVYAPTTEHITATLEETRALARLVDDLRTLSLAKAGQLPLVWETVDIAELLADVCTSFSGQAKVAEIDLRDETAHARSIETTADVGRLDQVCSNLVFNALQYTPAGGTTTLRGERVTDGVRITVSDTGKGIPSSLLFWAPAKEHRSKHLVDRCVAIG